MEALPERLEQPQPGDSLALALRLAALIGRAGNDAVDVSYTSLFIALLWLRDNVSEWLNSYVQPLEAKVDAVYRTRHVQSTDAERLRAAAEASSVLEPITYSPSARRVLTAAEAIAREVSSTIGTTTHHVAAVYFFRNPPDHDTQLTVDWAFDSAKWRAAFVAFTNSESSVNPSAWTPVFAPHLDPEALARLPALIETRYRFEPEALAVLDDWWKRSVPEEPHRYLRSKDLFETLNLRDTFDDHVSSNVKAADVERARILSIPLALSAGSRHVLDGAQSLAVTTTGGDRIGVRHLKAAVILVKTSNAHRALLGVGRSLPARRRALHRHVTRYHVDDDAAEWSRALIGSREPDLSRYHPDDPDKGDDQLDVRRFATAFALLIAAKDVAAPLSIGISGDWGSGKSFFMRLMRLETERITKAAGADPRFHTNVVPIQFNAWHYSEKDLLASLVQTIFLELQKSTLLVQKESEQAGKLRTAAKALDSAEKQLADARSTFESDHKHAEKARRDAQRKLEKAELDAADIVEASAGQLKSALQKLGLSHLTALLETAHERHAHVRVAVAQVETHALRSRSAIEWLLRARIAWRSVALAAVVVAASVLVFFWLRPSLGQSILTFVAEGLAAVALAVRWAQKQLAAADAGLAEFEKVRAKLDADTASRRAAIDRAVNEAEARAVKSASALEEAERARQDATKQVEVALEETKSINQLARLIEDRITLGSYDKYLGLVAAVRSDFDQLSTLIEQAAKNAESSKLSFRRIDRIVLYIDDLDRCPTDKVILVLEAIHLLLAFKLFVVVVGLDIRWASYSLEEKYPGQLKATSGPSSLDYLEKIFQIPFWLAPMDEQSSRRLLGAMVPPVRTAMTEALRAHGDSSSGQLAGDGAGTTNGQRSTSTNNERAASPETELLSIEKEERNFMLRLAPALSRSPRRLKRFVNSYLLLRAALDPVEHETFVLDGGARGNYREAMVLLALVTGIPRAWRPVVKALMSAAPPATMADLRTIAIAGLAAEEIGYFDTAFEIYRQAGESMTDLCAMAPKVARFSFHRDST